jgi:DNA segregation ATPase FtsK/SpoIIIE-like protein
MAPAPVANAPVFDLCNAQEQRFLRDLLAQEAPGTLKEHDLDDMEILTFLFSVLSTVLGAFAVYKILKIEARLGKGNLESLGEDGDDDELYERAKEEVIHAGKASTAYLQRRLRIGYGRAARLLELLEDNGIVAPAKGSAPRAVLDQRGK